MASSPAPGTASQGSFLVDGLPAVSYCNPADPFFRRLTIRAVEILSGQPRLQRLYDAFMRSRGKDDNFWLAATDHLGLTVSYEPGRLAGIPREGPLIIIANHPYGVLDGLAMGHLASLARPDFKLLAHAVLGRAEPLRPYLIPIEFDGASSAVRTNVQSKRAAVAHLKEGGTIVIFPAGRVSTADNLFRPATDAPWKLFAAKLIHCSGATVLPVYFEGQNGFLFHLVSKFSEALREALLMREVVRHIGTEIRAHIGRPIPPEELARFTSRQQMLDHLRKTVYGLATQRTTSG